MKKADEIKGKHVAYIPPGSHVEGHGYRVSIVVDGEAHHRPTGDWPYEGKKGQTAPWFWGPTFEDAQAAAVEYNQKMGISEKEAAIIVARSMTKGVGKRRN